MIFGVSMFRDDIEDLRKKILVSKLLCLPEEIESQIISIAPAIPDGLSTLYKSRQTFSSTVTPDASPGELFKVKIRSDRIDENRLEAGLAVMKITGKFELSVSDLERACTKEKKIHRKRLRDLEIERNSGFGSHISDGHLKRYLANLSSGDLLVLSQFVESYDNLFLTRPIHWQSLLRRIVMGLRGEAITNLAHRINSVCKSYLRSSPDDIAMADERYRILIPTAPADVSVPVWKCAHWLAAKASPRSPFNFEVDTTVRDRIVGLNEAIQNSAKRSSPSHQNQRVALSGQIAVAITL